MEVNVYVENGVIETKNVSIGSAIKYGRNTDDIIERYKYDKSKKTNQQYISDKSIEDILKTNYFKYGIIPRSLFLDLNTNQEKLFYILEKVDASLLNNLSCINMPEKLLCKINNFIDSCHTYLDIIHKNYKLLSDFDNLLCQKIDKYRNQLTHLNSITYFDKVLYFNRIRNFINELKHEKMMDFQYFLTNLLKFKYFTLLNEEDVINIHEQYVILENIYNTCHENIEFLDENNELNNYKIKNGSIKIDEIIIMLKKYIDLF